MIEYCFDFEDSDYRDSVAAEEDVGNTIAITTTTTTTNIKVEIKIKMTD